ncbi:MAG: hypothetical protein JO283_19275 [Bradyrhizobium sp.]|nr:hypothetical protein [Bradyrhizobium sp.]
MVGAAPLLLLYWLYRPTVLTDPDLGALKAPATVALLLLQPAAIPRRFETSSQAAVTDLAKVIDEREPAAKKPKNSSGSRGLHQIVRHRGLQFTGGAGWPAPGWNVSAAVNNPTQHTGISKSAVSADADEVHHSGTCR